MNGFPMNQAALERMQTAYSIFNALGNIVGDKTIISGCTVIGANTSNGVVYVNGEVFEFRGGVTQATVIIKEDVTNLVYKNNNSYPAVKTRYVQFGTGVGQMNWADFKAGFPTKDIAAGLLGKADQTSFDALADAFALVYTKMLTIQEGAQKNVQADMAETDDTKDSFIKNNTAIIPLVKASVPIGDVIAGSNLRTIPLGITLPNANYMVLGTLVSKAADYNNDNDVFFQIRDKSTTSFKLLFKQIETHTQNLDFDYILIAL